MRLTSVEKRDDSPMSDTSAHTTAGGAATSIDTEAVGQSAYFIGRSDGAGGEPRAIRGRAAEFII